MEHDEEDVEPLTFLLRFLLAEPLVLVEKIEAALGRRFFDHFLSSQELLVLEHRLDRERMSAGAVDLLEDLGPSLRAVEKLDDLPEGVLELVVFQGRRILDDPLDFSQLHLA